jgi:hypothetical protein
MEPVLAPLPQSDLNLFFLVKEGKKKTMQACPHIQGFGVLLAARLWGFLSFIDCFPFAHIGRILLLFSPCW